MVEADDPEASAPRSRVRELVAECLDRFEGEGQAAIDAVCAANPDHAEVIRGRLARLAEMGLLRRDDGGEERFPERLGDFRLLRRLGGGGMGVVFLAEQLSLKRSVALKLVRPGQLYFGHTRERFRREAQVIATLRHPGIVPVHAFGEEGDVPYYAMEFIDGASLAELLERLATRTPSELSAADFDAALAGENTSERTSERARLGWVPLCLALIRDAADALAHAHASGVIHRDLKPSNVMLTRDGSVRLVDFGLSTSSGASKITRTGAELGSLPWMPPELLRSGLGAVDARGDVYSLGVTLYQLLTLRSPFATRDNEVTRRNILAGDPTRPRALNLAIPRDAEIVCLTAMDPDPARRYATAEAFARDLDHVLALRPIAARPAGAWLKANRWAQRSPARAVAAALALLIVVGGPIGYGVMQGQAAEREGRERGRAEQNAARAKRAVDEMLADVGADDLQSVPQMEPVRRKLLEKSLAFYQEMLAETPADPALELERARTGKSIADLEKQLGRFAEAERGYAAQIELLRRLAAAKPDDAACVDALASCLAGLAALQNADGRKPLATANWKESIGLLEALEKSGHASRVASLNLIALAQDLAYDEYARGDNEAALRWSEVGVAHARAFLAREPEAPDAQRLLAGSLRNAGTQLANLARPEESRARYREAFALIEALIARTPSDRRARNDFVEVANNYGLDLLAGDDHAETERVLRLGVDAARSLDHDFPGDPELRKQLAVIAANYGSYLFDRGETAKAATELETAAATLDQLAKEFPFVVEYPYFLAAALANTAGAHTRLGDVDRAAAEVERAIQLLRNGLARSPGHTGMTSSLATALFAQADVQRARGELDGALESARDALALKVGRGDVLYAGVEVLADCTRKADELGDETWLEQATALTFEALRAARQGGFRDAERLRTSPQFELLRERPEFAAALAEISATKQ